MPQPTFVLLRLLFAASVGLLVLSGPAGVAAPRPDETPVEAASVEDADAGVWYGVMDIGAREFRFVIEAVADDSDAVTYQLTSLDEGEQVFPLSQVTLSEDVLEFAVTVSNAEYRGTREGDRVTGEWSQRGNTFPLEFQKLAERPPDQPAEVWVGEIDTVVQKLRVQLRVYREDDGSERLYFDSLTQKSGGFRTYRTQTDSSLKLAVPILQAMFDGVLDPATDTAVGKWTQNGVAMDMEIQKRSRPIVMKAESAARPQTPQPPYPYDVRDVEFENPRDTVRLAGTLTTPRDVTAAPAVVLISGSGPQDRDETIVEHRPFHVLADHLTRNGIAVLRYDDRGVGQSTGEYVRATTLDFSRDAEAAFDFLKTQSGIDPARIGLIGHSEGGLIAPLVASRRIDVAFIILIAGPGVNGQEILLAQGERFLRASGQAGQAEIRAQRLTQTALMEAVLSAEPGDDPATLQQRVLTKLARSLPPESLQESQLRQAIVTGIQTLNTSWFRFFLEHEPGPVLRSVTCPVLAVYGEKDVQVDAELNLPAVRTALKTGGNSDFEVVTLPGVNHLLQPCRTGAVTEYATIEETMSTAALTLLSDWITSRFLPDAEGTDPSNGG